MKLFLQRIFLFLAIPIISCSFCLLLLSVAYKHNKDLFKVDQEVRIIFMGDSHTTLAINDKLIEDVANFSQLSEDYFYTYYKLEQILIRNPKIEKIYLGYGHQSFSDYRDSNFSIKTPRYFFILPLEEQFNLLYSNSKNLPSYVLKVIRTGAVDLFSNSKPRFLGGYKNPFEGTVPDKEEIEKRITEQFTEDGNVRGFSSRNIFYLNKIRNLAKKKEVELTLFATPLHPLYYQKIPHKFVKKRAELISKYNYYVLDYTHLLLDKKYFTPDGDHVSQSGATIVTLNYKYEEAR